METNLGNVLLVAFGLLCVLPVILVLVLGVVVYRVGMNRLSEWVSPDVAKLETRMVNLRQRSPASDDETLIQQVIHREALKCGFIGAVTGLGGFYTLPVALPIDLVLSLRIQAALVNFIAETYGQEVTGKDSAIRTSLIMTGSGRVAESTTRAATALLTRLIGKSFSKLIPFVGAAISFGVNYLIVQAIGRAALRWYAEQPTNRV